MEFIKTKLKGVYIIQPQVFQDNRGWFAETYSKTKFDNAGISLDFVQDNQSLSKDKGVLRGLHFQNNPMAQTKLVRCTQGEILDVAVDIRRGSDTYLQYVAVKLSEQNKTQLLIPRGFAHGFVTLTDDAIVQYKVDNVYSKAHDRSIAYNDQSIGVEWKVENPILSQKDIDAPLLKDSDANFSIKVLVTGYNGQLGYDVIKKLNNQNYECIGVDKTDFDITDYNETRNFIKKYNPDVVVHCAAYTAVDKAEENQDLCHEINVVGSKNIARVCREIDAKMVYISTDYVYDGQGDTPYETTSEVNPISVYGKTKLQGELACQNQLEKLFIVRTSWVFGVNGNNFVKTMLRLAKEKESLGVVDEQIGSPTYTPDLADFIFYLINTQKYGTYHCTNEGFISWYDFAKTIFEYTNTNIQLKPIPTSEFKTLAARPKNSRLSKQCLIDSGYKAMPTWQDALKRFLQEIKEV